jgi:hypothetical protein
VSRSFAQKVDPFQFGCDSKKMKSWQTPPLNKSTQQRKAKPSQATEGKKRTKREDPSPSQKKQTWCLVLQDVLLVGRLYPSSLLRWRYACLVLKDAFLLAWRIYPSSTKVDVCSACFFLYLLFVTESSSPLCMHPSIK